MQTKIKIDISNYERFIVSFDESAEPVHVEHCRTLWAQGHDKGISRIISKQVQDAIKLAKEKLTTFNLV